MMAPNYNKKVPEFEKVPESDKKYLKKAGGHIGRNVVQINNRDEDIILNNTNYQTSSQKFREMQYLGYDTKLHLVVRLHVHFEDYNIHDM